MPRPQRKQSNGSPEYHLQTWFDVFLTEKGVLHNASVSAFRVSIGVAMKMKRAGYKKGFPDMQICEPRGQYHGMFIELKCGTYPSQEQKEWRDNLLQRGYLAIIVPGNMDYRQAQEYLEVAVENYLSLK
jgi:hypothetical protein